MTLAVFASFHLVKLHKGVFKKQNKYQKQLLKLGVTHLWRHQKCEMGVVKFVAFLQIVPDNFW